MVVKVLALMCILKIDCHIPAPFYLGTIIQSLIDLNSIPPIKRHSILLIIPIFNLRPPLRCTASHQNLHFIFSPGPAKFWSKILTQKFQHKLISLGVKLIQRLNCKFLNSFSPNYSGASIPTGIIERLFRQPTILHSSR